MPRKPRLFVSGATYHVYCRVARGEFVFNSPDEAEAFVEIVRSVGNLDGWRILAWCLMGNHYHLVVKTGTVPLWRSMARLQGRVSRGHNRRKQYLGRLWQSRYKARVIDSQDYFRQVISYVHLNPVAAGVTRDPAEYPQSGHREILGLRQARLVDLASVLRGFGEHGWAESRDNYLAWVRAVAEAKWFSRGVECLPWWERARDADEIAVVDRHPDATLFDGRIPDDDRPQLDLDDFVSGFERVTGHQMTDLASPLRSPSLIRGRIELTMLAVDRYRFQSGEIAKLIGKHPTSLTRWLKQGLVLKRDDQRFRIRLDHLDRAIALHHRANASMRNVAP